ncbi:TlpA family protein disulfide reductase [Chondrinema litorale]|uniref:TlpA family protein disulfide reductase n=1 Tax=Chondrinema litorale TaxID=2994555 RepID=UPI002543921B|nr:TlpA disulfide reductase family protein [Chondrinema litorale]UZR94314.1 TlpA disulfide reductase family protein [Chondrinema litorale]
MHLIKLLRFWDDSYPIEKWFELVDSAATDLIKMNCYDEYAKVASSKGNHEEALKYSNLSVNWAKEHLNAPERTYREKCWYALSDEEIQNSRKRELAIFLVTQSEVLAKLDQKDKAYKACQLAIENSNLEDARLNDRIVELLISINRTDDAKDIAKIALSKGKASTNLKKVLGDEPDAGIDSIANDYLLSKEDYLKSLMKNNIAPNFDLYSLDGEKVSLEDLKGKVVVLDFWATWCAPCVMAFPYYKEVVEKYRDDENVVFYFINLDKDKEKEDISSFMESRKVDFNVLLDKENDSSKDFAVSGLPTKMIIDKNGYINFGESGFKSDKEEFIQELSLMIELAKNSESLK